MRSEGRNLELEYWGIRNDLENKWNQIGIRIIHVRIRERKFGAPLSGWEIGGQNEEPYGHT